MADANLDRFRAAASAFASFHWYFGLLLYGSYARAQASRVSDVDLVVVTTQRLSVQRIHTDWIDLNLLTIEDLHSVARRIEQGERLPWDAMFDDIAIVDDPTVQLKDVVDRLRSAYATASRDHPGLDPIRFMVQRQMRALDHPGLSLLEASAHLGTILTLLAVAHGAIQQAPWKGSKFALRSLERQQPDVAQILRTALEVAPDWSAALKHLRAAAQLVLEPAGGCWDSGALVLRSDIAAAGGGKAPLPVDTAELAAAAERAADSMRLER